MARRPLSIALLLSVCVVVAHLVALDRAIEAAQQGARPYAVGVPRRADRVVLVVADSLPLRIAEDPRLMPRMRALRERGASGVLWASKLTSTLPGILGLSTGMPGSLTDSLRIFGSTGYARWTLFDDVHDRGEALSFNGDPMWITLFGSRGSRNHASDGRAGTDFEDNLAALHNAADVLRSASPPALTVVHITETDHASHRYGTRDPRYEATIRRWDAAIGDFVEHALDGHTAVIVTSDHGNDELGTHGGAAEIYRRVPVWMFGQGIRPMRGVAMNGVDMPATIALLLGTRMPGGARAVPATAPLALDAREEARALLATYDHLLAIGPRPEVESAHRAQLGALLRLEQEGRFEDVIAPARLGTTSLVDALDVPRTVSLTGLAWAVLIAVAAAILCALSFTRSARPSAWLALGILGCEAVLVTRYGFAAPLKGLLPHIRRGHLGPAAALVPVAMLVVGWLVLTRRRAILDALRGLVDRPLGAIVVAFTFCSAIPTLSNAALLFLCLLAASLYRARVRPSAWLALPICAGYFALGTHVVLPRLGEATIPRFLWALAAIGPAIAWLRVGPLRAFDRLPRAALVLLLLIAPFGRIPLDPDAHLLVRGLALLALGVLASMALSRGAPRVLLAAYALTGVFVMRPANALFPFALALPLLLLAFPVSAGPSAAWSFRAALLALALAALSKPEDVPTLAILAAVLIALAEQLADRGAHLAVGLAAVTITAGRQALFELFGHTDSPAPGYGFVDLDLAPGFLGSEGFDFWRATFLILLKVILTSGLVVAALHLARLRPQQGLRIAAAAGAMLVLGVLHTTLRLNLSIGLLTDQYDKQLFSTFIHTAMYLGMVLGWLALRAVTWLPDRPARRVTVADPLDYGDEGRSPSRA
ncbi:MAG: alkaline phosphatase family protein [Minicystis sp.]